MATSAPVDETTYRKNMMRYAKIGIGVGILFLIALIYATLLIVQDIDALMQKLPATPM